MTGIQLNNFGLENRNCANSRQELAASFNDIPFKVEYQSNNF